MADIKNRKHALTMDFPVYAISLVNSRYWPEGSKRANAIENIHERIGEIFSDIPLVQINISSDSDVDALLKKSPAGAVLFVPMTGSVQPWMMRLAGHFDAVGIMPGYDEDLMPKAVADLLLEFNAGPATLEMFAVLKNKYNNTAFITDKESFIPLWHAAQAVSRLRESKLLIIGQTEPWVLSCERDLALISDVIGNDMEHVPIEELYQKFEKVSVEEAKALADKYGNSASEKCSVSDDDILTASRLSVAFDKVLAEHSADGAAVSCFKLLQELNTTSCIALSVLNDDPDFVGACEGDLDSVVTLALLKALTGKPGWMGNPLIGKNKIFEIVHCTSALAMKGKDLPFSLHRHHESGVGVSTRVQLPVDEEVTVCRLSVRERKITAFHGKTEKMPLKKTCHTQIRVQMNDIEFFMKNMLGLHQTIVYGDYTKKLELCAKMLGFEFVCK